MQRIYVKALINTGDKVETNVIDVTDLSITSLSKLKEIILEKGIYTDSVIILDKLIREKVEMLIPHNNIYRRSYIKNYKENKKEEKQKIRTKYRRKKYDQY